MTTITELYKYGIIEVVAPLDRSGRFTAYPRGAPIPSQWGFFMPYKDLDIRRRKGREYSRQWRSRNPSAVKQMAAAWYEQHREERATYNQAWFAAHPDYHTQWDDEHREERNKQARNRYDPTIGSEKFRRWVLSHPLGAKQRGYRYAARLKGAFVEEVDMALIYERDGGKCQICHKKVTLIEASLDHVLPLFNGGLHMETNVRLTHRWCNVRRKNLGSAQLYLL